MSTSFQFAQPKFGDWASYAGFDRTTGETDFGIPPRESLANKDASGNPIEPPKTLGEYFDRKVAPIKNAYNQLTAAGSELSKGNVMNAYNTMQKPSTQFGMTSGQTNEAITFDHLWN